MPALFFSPSASFSLLLVFWVFSSVSPRNGRSEMKSGKKGSERASERKGVSKHSAFLQIAWSNAICYFAINFSNLRMQAFRVVCACVLTCGMRFNNAMVFCCMPPVRSLHRSASLERYTYTKCKSLHSLICGFVFLFFSRAMR